MSDSSPARRPRLPRWWPRSGSAADTGWDDAGLTEPIAAGEYENGRYQVGQYESRQYGSPVNEPEPYAGGDEGGLFESGPYRPATEGGAYSRGYPAEAFDAPRGPADPTNLFAPAGTGTPGRYAPAPDEPYPYPTDEDPEDEEWGERRRGPVLVTAFVVLVVGLVGAGGWWIASGPVGASSSGVPERVSDRLPAKESSAAKVPPASSQPDPSDPPTALVGRATISAEATSADGKDSAGAEVSYRVDNVADGSAVTTWRMNGDGTGRSILFSFDQQITVTELAMTNGYTKQDRRSGADRYLEERRITRVTWTTDDGTRFEQSLADPERTLQRMQIPVTSTSSLTLTIERTTEPGDPERDYTAISEVEIGGAFS